MINQKEKCKYIISHLKIFARNTKFSIAIFVKYKFQGKLVNMRKTNKDHIEKLTGKTRKISFMTKYSITKRKLYGNFGRYQ